MKCPHCHQEVIDPDFFRKCYDLIALKFPYLAAANMHPINIWKMKGWSYDLHVLPAVEAAVKNNKRITLMYIQRIMESFIETEIKDAPQQEKKVELNQEELKAWKRSMGIYVP